MANVAILLLRVAGCGGVLLLPATSALASDWPQMRGPFHNGVSGDQVKLADTWPATGPKIVWEFKFPGGAGAGAIDGATGPGLWRFRGAGSPVVAGGKVYVQAGCVDSKDAERIRAQRGALEVQLATTPREQWSSNAQYAAVVTAWEALKKYGFWCFDATDGRLLWRKDVPAQEGGGWFSSSTPSVADGRFYFLTRSAILLCLDAATGDELWRKQITASPGLGLHGDHGSPTVVAGTVVLSHWTEAGTVALDAATGEQRWQRTDVHGRHSTPLPWAVEGKPVVLCAGHCLSVDRGETLWKVPAWNDECQAALADNRLAAIEVAGKEWRTVVYELGAKEARVLFRLPVPNQLGGAALLSGDRVHFASFNLHCLDAATGEVRWKSEAGTRNAFSAPVLASGKIIGIRENALWMVDAATGKVLAEYKAPERFHTRGSVCRSPAICGGRLYVHEDDGMVCYELAAGAAP